jgi:triacylglycerol lipase
MLARIQQILVFGVLALVITWAVVGVTHHWPWPAIVAGGFALALPHAWILAIEFAALGRMDPGAGLPRPSRGELATAWWGEVRTGLRVFAWAQPFRSNEHPDFLPPGSEAARRGVLLVHGFVCNRGLWNPWMRRLRDLGVPHVAVNLEPVFGSIERYVDIIERAIKQLEAATGQPPLVVAHSMGGLAVRAWLRHQQADARVHGVITVGTPHHGTWLARFALTANTRQMRRDGEWLQALASEEPADRRRRFTSYYSHCDNIVFPACTSMLEGADNRHLPGIAHVHLVFQPAVWSEVTRRLDIDSGAD